MAALRIVLEREKEKKKKQKLSAFEDYIATQVAADSEGTCVVDLFCTEEEYTTA